MGLESQKAHNSVSSLALIAIMVYCVILMLGEGLGQNAIYHVF